MHLPRIAFHSSFLGSCFLSLVLAGCSSASSGGHDETPPVDDDASCGVGPSLEQDGGVAVVGDSGVVTFTSVQVGEAADFIVSVQDSADVSETILGATVTGPGESAFTVTSTLPIAVPAGQPVQIGVRFDPPTVASFTAQLQLQTMKMGVSTITLQAAGVQ